MDGLMMRYELTLIHVLERAGQYFHDRTIVSREPDGTLSRTTYGSVVDRSRRLAAALGALGIERGDRVATLGWNHARHLEAYFGVPVSGAVLHTINPRLHADDIAFVMRAAQDRALLIDESLLPLVDALPADARPEHVIVWASDPAAPPGGDLLDHEQLIGANEPLSAYPDLSEDDAASMCFTSATTGRPKGVAYSHRALVLHSIVSAMPDEFDISGRDVVMPAVPMFHVNAWGLPYTAALVGAGLVLPGPQLDPESLLALITGEGVTFTAGVPTVWLRVLETLGADPGAYDLSRLHTILVGGSAASPALIEAFDELGVAVLHAWGMTETTPIGSVSRLTPTFAGDRAEEVRLRATQGIAAPLVDMRATGPEGPVPWDGSTMGELEVRGPWIAGAYLGGVGQDRFTDDGWLRTGDIAIIDPEGYLKITDRMNDLIKSGGEWISSLDLENTLMEHPAVREAAVIAVPDEVWGERPLAVVVRATDVEPEELLDLLRTRFAKWQIPDGVVFVDEIPKTATGKFSKRELRERTAHDRANDA